MNNREVALLTGGNLGNRYQNLTFAREALTQYLGAPLAVSQLYETAAWGGKSEGAYLNQVLVFAYAGSAYELLRQCLAIETSMGRERVGQWTNRIIDIDLLYLDQEQLQSDDLQLPHPRLHERRFTLVPLAEVRPHWMHPVLGQSVADLLASCTDPLPVQTYAEELL